MNDIMKLVSRHRGQLKNQSISLTDDPRSALVVQIYLTTNCYLALQTLFSLQIHTFKNCHKNERSKIHFRFVSLSLTYIFRT